MKKKFTNALERLTLLQRFLLASLMILVGGMLGLGDWVAREIEQGVVHRSAATTALFVDSFIAPSLQELANGETLSAPNVETLNTLLQQTALGRQIVSFKVWGPGGKVLFSTQPSTIGQVFPVEGGLAAAWQGAVSAKVSRLENAENALERAQQAELLEIYSPVRMGGTGQIIAVAEFYQRVDDLNRELAAARQRSWLMVGLAMLVMYLLLGGFVRGASITIDQQRAVLSTQVKQLTELLAQNETLHERIRKAAARFSTLNERLLRRFSAELHDGAAQDLGLALLRLDHVVEQAGQRELVDPAGLRDDLDVIQGSVQRALQEVRSLSAGLGLPQLAQLSLAGALARAVRAHEQRTGTKVETRMEDLPEDVSLPVKIAAYRLVQEALNNAYRHAGGLGQSVAAGCQNASLEVRVSDAGPGFEPGESPGSTQHLGLIGMRERVESLGGTFDLQSAPGSGTRITAVLPLGGQGEQDG